VGRGSGRLTKTELIIQISNQNYSNNRILKHEKNKNGRILIREEQFGLVDLSRDLPLFPASPEARA
jgi:hypothetical protein